MKKYTLKDLILTLSIFFTTTINAINTQDGIALKVFGPSPNAYDSRAIFEPVLDANGNVSSMVKDNYWTHLREEFNAIYVHILLYANSSDHPDNPSRFANIPLNQATIRLTDNQLKGLEYLQREKGFKIIVDTGLSLGPEAGRSCDSTSHFWKFAESAATDDFNQIKILMDAGIEIDQFTADGPFLRIVKGSEKAFSCATGTSGSTAVTEDNNAFTTGQSAIIISKYLSRLKNKINSYSPKNNTNYNNQAPAPLVNIALNLPNLPLDPINNDFTQGVNLHGFHENVNFDNILQNFSTRSEYPPINQIVFDYPYSYLLNKDQSTNTEQGISSYLIHLFNGKLLHLNDYRSLIRGNPSFAFMLNTEGGTKAPSNVNSSMVYNDSSLELVGNIPGHRRGKYCVVVGSKTKKNSLNGDADDSNDISHLKIWNQNRCFENLSNWNVCATTNASGRCNSTQTAQSLDFATHRNSYVTAENNRYYDHSENYYLRVSRNVLNNLGIQAEGIYFTSWHDFPNNMHNYGYKVREILRNNRPSND